mgnify:FL=1
MNRADLGHMGEAVAAKYYIRQGYLLLNHNYRTRMGELDLILYKADTIVFAEVKTRTSAQRAAPAEAVDYYKQQRLIAAAGQYLQQSPYADANIRSDEVEILPAGSGWQGGYRIIGILQVVLTVVLLFSLPLWKLPQDVMGGEPFTPQHRSFPELLKITGVPEVLVCFLCYCALESTAGMWASSYCTLVRGLDAQTAASWASLFYLGITAGRFVSGFLTIKMSDRNMIRLGQVLIALGILLVLLPAGNNVLFVGLILIGLGCAPVYPCIIHETPVNFGRELSMSMTGLQMAFAYVGSCLAPPLFGLLAQNVTPRLYPWYLAVGLVVMVIMSESLHAKKAAEHR